MLLSAADVLSAISRARGNYARDIPRRNERTGCPPYARREYEAVPLETIAGEVGDERKVRKEGRRRSLVQTEEPVFAPHAARRVCTSPRSITFPYLLLLHLRPPFASSCLLAFASTFFLCYSALSPLTALNCRQRASPDRRLLKPLSRRRVLLHGGLRHCERVLEEPCTRLRGRNAP